MISWGRTPPVHFFIFVIWGSSILITICFFRIDFRGLGVTRSGGAGSGVGIGSGVGGRGSLAEISTSTGWILIPLLHLHNRYLQQQINKQIRITNVNILMLTLIPFTPRRRRGRRRNPRNKKRGKRIWIILKRDCKGM
jgi:hypothetical protein